MNCSQPLDVEVLTAYWFDRLPPGELDAIEEHLLGCDACGDRLREVLSMAEAVRDLAREGCLRMVVSDAFLERAAAEGLRVRVYAPPFGGAVQCTVTPEDEILVARLAADFSGAHRVDLAILDEQGCEYHRFSDIPVPRRSDSVILHEPIDFLRAAPTHKMTARLLAVDEAGNERTLGEYGFHHTRTLPGAPGW